MLTNISFVYACGDVCTVNWVDQLPLWRQMRLWTQARTQGIFTAMNIVDKDSTDLSMFSAFAHSTTFGGRKVSEVCQMSLCCTMRSFCKVRSVC